VYSRKYSMLVKCEKCGYENFPQHRFCGMCAAPLPFPTAPSARPNPAPPPLAPKPVVRPSPAAVERESVDPRSVRYLLEDEPAPSHRGRNVFLFILLAAVAAAGWHWRGDLGPLAGKIANRTAGASAQPDSSVPGSASQAAPAAGASAQVEKPSDPGPVSPIQTPPSSTPAAAAPSSAPDPTQPTQPDQSGSASPIPPSDSAAAADVPKADDSGEAPAQPAPAIQPPKARTRAASASRIDDVETEGEKYLYGNGVRENCAQARKSLMSAAQRNNAKAQNVLGTMYATGHCATRDLPTAYRWFGRSLRQDPNNTRIEQDLKVLWSQMTPEEQRLALRDTR
jgi:hypothetical protein